MKDNLWQATGIPPRPKPSLDGRQTVDVCVVGGGVGGTASAYFMSRSGATVILLEADRIGSGAAGKSSGFVNAGLWAPPERIFKAIGEIYGARLIALLGEAPRKTFDLIRRLGLECEANNSGTLQCAPDDLAFADLKARFASWDSQLGDIRLADAAETAQLTGTSAYRGALIDYRAGVLQPLSYVRSLARAAESAGATIYENSLADAFRFSDGHWHIRTKYGGVSARSLLITTEAYTIGSMFGLAREHVPMPYFNAAIRPLTASERSKVMPAGQPIVDLRKVVSSYRFDSQGRLIVGSIGELAGLDGAVNRQWVSRKIARLFPTLRGVEVEHAWTGRIGVTKNHMPTIHRLGPQAYALGGYNGRGIAAATVLAELLSDVIMGRMPKEDLPVPLTDPSIARMRMARSGGIRVGAATFHLMDGHWN